MNKLANILIVEDDSTIRTILQMMLRNAGFTHVKSAARGDEGLEAIRRDRPQLVLLDLMLPGLDGLSLCSRVRADPELADVRIHAVLRRNDPMAAGRTMDGLVVDERGSAALLNGTVLSLTRGEFRLLALLTSRPGRVYTRSQIIASIQDEEKSVTERTVDVQLVGLRKKLGDWAAHIETIRGVGYRVKP